MDDVLVGLILNTLTAACLQELGACQGMQTVVEQALTLPALQESLRRHNKQYDRAAVACRGQLEPHQVGGQCNASMFIVHRPAPERYHDQRTNADTQALPAGFR